MTEELRWNDYVLRRDSGVTALWQSLLENKRDVLYIAALGFDRRMCLGLELLAGLGGTGKRDVCLVTFDEGAESPSQGLQDARRDNEERLTKIAESGWQVNRRAIGLYSDAGRRVGGRAIARAFGNNDEFSAYTDVVLDVSAFPRGLYFPLVARLLTVFQSPFPDGRLRNLHVVAAHSPSLDAATRDEGIDEDATYLHGFSAAEFEREATGQQPKVWLPALGRGQLAQLDSIHTLVQPDEICPVLPSPAANPREADDLILEYREFLFDRLRVEPRNMIYASESNPFEVYRAIVRSVRHYDEALAPLQGCKAVVSAMSSKLVSLGVLLAAYELRDPVAGLRRVDVGVAHVETQGYVLDDSSPDGTDAELFHLWLAGECYA